MLKQYLHMFIYPAWQCPLLFQRGVTQVVCSSGCREWTVSRCSWLSAPPSPEGRQAASPMYPIYGNKGCVLSRVYNTLLVLIIIASCLMIIRLHSLSTSWCNRSKCYDFLSQELQQTMTMLCNNNAHSCTELMNEIRINYACACMHKKKGRWSDYSRVQSMKFFTLSPPINLNSQTTQHKICMYLT